MIIFTSTNDSVQFHENVLSTFLNRKFNMYLDEDNEFNGAGDDEFDFDSDLDTELAKPKSQAAKSNSISNKKNTVCDLFSLYGNMDQHKRAEILSKFCKAKSGVLVCTVGFK